VRVRWRERVVDVELRAGTPVIVGREDLAA
jgi:hypothetical protein